MLKKYEIIYRNGAFIIMLQRNIKLNIQLELQRRSNSAAKRKIIYMNIHKVKAKLLEQWKIK